jgi:ribose/xylose/arabinose/galactoside ABC-type transport system permease subunit
MKKTIWINRLVDHLIWIVLTLTIVVVALTIDGFFQFNNLSNVLLHGTVLGLLSIAAAMALIGGEMDLSLGVNMGFVGYLVAWISLGKGDVGSGWNLNPILAGLIGVGVGVGIGWVNGSLVTRLKMNSFLVTLGTLIVLGGLTYVINQARTLNGINPVLLVLGGEKTFGVPNSVILTAFAFGIAVIISRFTSGGRRLYAVGSNAVAARAAGIDPGAVKRRMFMVAGGVAGVAGLLIIGELGSAPANVGQGVIFEVFAATVIGGVSLTGGRGSYFDVLGGVLLLSMIANALNLTAIDPFWVEPIRGFIILFAVFLDSQRESLRMWLLKHATSTNQSGSEAA